MSGHPPYFFVEPGRLADDTVKLEGPEARHLLTVRRAAPGDEVTLSDGHGSVAEARIASTGRGSVTLALVDRRTVERPRPRIEVLLGLAKTPKVDSAIRQLVELGVDAVTLFPATRSVVRWDAGQAGAARRRWEGIAQAAAQQSHRAWLPELEGPLPLGTAAERAASQGAGLVADPGAPSALSAVLAGWPVDPAGVWVVAGPEGGLTEAEVGLLREADAVPATLGAQILRAETAPIVLASILLYHFARFERYLP
ncbi:MAG TPA: RsmE family RNA methyltransferase [Actinomycetota bacterium]|nr:RsmE family RNA methyltransferase [Actinomycetota bacterium]